jgi:hypothetical protein
MLDSISALLEIGEKAPPAIDYFYMPPHPQWVPDVALKKAHQNQEFLLSVVGLHVEPRVQALYRAAGDSRRSSAI